MVLLHLLIPLVTWSVVNGTADINDFPPPHLISLFTSRVSLEEVHLPSFNVVELSVEIMGNLVWGR